jgi:hypothetical protein
MAGGGEAHVRPNSGRGSRRRRGGKGGGARGGLGLPVGGPGKARDGRNRAAHGGPDRRPVAHGGGELPAGEGGKGRAGRLQWGTGKPTVRSIWGGKERRDELHGDRSLAALMGRRRGLNARGEGLERPFCRQAR